MLRNTHRLLGWHDKQKALALASEVYNQPIMPTRRSGIL